jgi:outer membrane receptor protein involved in Fe transport
LFGNPHGASTLKYHNGREMFGERMRSIQHRSPLALSSGLAALALVAYPNTSRAAEQTYLFDIPAEPLGQALTDFSRISAQQIIFSEEAIGSRKTTGLQGRYTVARALAALLASTDLKVEQIAPGVVMVRPGADKAAQLPKEESTIKAGGPTSAIRVDNRQTAPQSDIANVETVIVSSSRITARGFEAPTPTTVIGFDDIERSAQPNLFSTIAQLPSLQNSTGTTQGNANTSAGTNGLSTLNVRGLGTIRTLTLIDGQRVVPAYVGGQTDVSQFPQLLIQRVDVVTGGASASWGSDAVSGVVNLVTEKKFTGIKGHLQTAVSTYGDDFTGLVQLAAGDSVGNSKGHIEGSLEYYHNDGVPASNTIGGGLANGRGDGLHVGGSSITPLAYSASATPAGVPQNTYVVGIQPNSYSLYGLITAGPLKGISFNANGMPTPFAYGSPCVATFCQGGDLSATIQGTGSGTTADDPITRGVLYARLSYDLAPDFEAYATLNYGSVFTSDQPNAGATKSGLTIQCSNVFLPASITAACAANNITNFTFGVSNYKFPSYIRIGTVRTQRRYVAGADGSFDLLGKHWSLDAYFEHGENDTSIRIRDITLTARYNAAIDAVAGANGTAVCRSVAAQMAGCIPIDIFGAAPIDPTAWRYIAPANGPHTQTAERQEAASLVINGSPFKNWAGDVSLAFGAEYREEAYRTISDPYGNGVAAADPNNAQYPADPLLDSANGNNWFAGNFHNGQGTYHVEEAYFEAVLPLTDGPKWGKADFNFAGRGTVYSTAGFVDTWKLGLTWNTPLNGLRLRALQSRDVRAPNLSELFAAPLTQNQTVIDRTTNLNVNVVNTQIGNLNLKPETAQTTEIGVIFRPDYIPELNLSVDYYRVGVKKGIATLTNQQEIDLCQISLNPTYCTTFFLKGVQGTANPSFTTQQPFNLASTIVDGFDMELRYQFDLLPWGVPGSFAFRGLSTHVSKFITDAGVPGQPLTESAGSATTPSGLAFVGGVPLWKSLLAQSWNYESLSFAVIERFYSDGAISPYAIVCQAPNCPPPTLLHPTANMNSTQGPFFVDVGGAYEMRDGMQIYFKVDNITNYAPRPFAQNTDPIGRMYRLGFRFDN